MSDLALFRRAEAALSRAVGAEVLLARVGRDEMDVLSGSGALAWDLLDRPRSVPGLAALLADLHGVSAQAIEGDVRRLLDDLEARGWVTRTLDDD